MIPNGRRARYRTCRRSGCPSGIAGWSKSSPGDRVIPIRSMTARDRRFAGTVNETISVEGQVAEAESQGGAGGLGGVAAAPVLAGEPPADLDAGREMRLEPRHRQADEADEIGHARRPRRPRARSRGGRNGRGSGRPPRRSPRGRAAGGRTPSRPGRRSSRRTPGDPRRRQRRRRRRGVSSVSGSVIAVSIRAGRPINPPRPASGTGPGSCPTSDTAAARAGRIRSGPRCGRGTRTSRA